MSKKKKVLNSEASVLDNASGGMGIANGEVQNGLAEALGIPNQFDGEGAQVSQSDTMFKALRWYLVSNMRQLLSQMYAEVGIVRTIVDVPVEDGLRGELEIKTKQLNEQEIQDLQSRMEEAGDINVVAQSLKWNRLYGGAGVIPITGQDPSSELDIEKIEQDSEIEFKAVDMWELYHSKQSEDLSEDMSYSNLGKDNFDYYGKRLHPSRVFILKGVEAPSFIRPRLRGWGLSVLESMVRSVNQYLKATDLMFEVLDEFKLDIFKIKGFAAALMHKNGAQKVQERTNLANYQKNYQNALTMDAEDDYVQKQLTFAGLGEAMTGIRMQVASDVRMPLTKLFGISAAGFSSGEDDIENYNAMVEADVRTKAKPIIIKIIKIRCMQLFGFIPDDLTLEYESLRMLSSEQEQAVKSQKYGRLIQARQAGLITEKEFREACNKDKLLPMQLDVNVENIEPPSVQAPQAGAPQAGLKSTTQAPMARNALHLSTEK